MEQPEICKACIRADKACSLKGDVLSSCAHFVKREGK